MGGGSELPWGEVALMGGFEEQDGGGGGDVEGLDAGGDGNVNAVMAGVEEEGGHAAGFVA